MKIVDDPVRDMADSGRNIVHSGEIDEHHARQARQTVVDQPFRSADSSRLRRPAEHLDAEVQAVREKWRT